MVKTEVYRLSYDFYVLLRKWSDVKMNTQNTETLFNRFDFLYRGRYLLPTENRMSDGFDCDDGWYELIYDLSEQLEQYRQAHPEAAELMVMQVKQKFGELRFHVHPRLPEVQAIIDATSARSRQCCEVTGQPGQLHQCQGYYQTLCPEVAAARGFVLVLPTPTATGDDNYPHPPTTPPPVDINCRPSLPPSTTL
jgi:hypothetical protein